VIPADIVVLAREDPEEEVYVKTDQLDGETDSKPRFSLYSSKQEMIEYGGIIECGPPVKEIDNFNGMLKFGADEQIQISVENMIWMNSVNASQTDIYGLVLFTGIETKAKLNTREASNKFGRFDRSLNNTTKFLFPIMFLSAFMLETTTLTQNWDVQGSPITGFFNYLILTSTLCSIALRTMLDIAKSVMSSNFGKVMPGCIIRNSMIPEELGAL